MKNSQTIRFGIAVLLVTAGCLLLIAGFEHGSWPIALATYLTMPRTAWTRPLTRRELWLMFGGMLALVILSVAFKAFVPASVSDAMDRIFHQPAFILPLWLLMLGALFHNCRRRRRELASDGALP